MFFFIDFIRTFVSLKVKQQGKANDIKKLKKIAKHLHNSKFLLTFVSLKVKQNTRTLWKRQLEKKSFAECEKHTMSW